MANRNEDKNTNRLGVVPYVSGSGIAIRSANQTYTITNDSTSRTLDATGATLGQLSNVVATLIRDLKTAGVINTA